MKIFVVLIGFLSACSAAQNPVEVAGHRFCVPKDHIIPKVAWVKPDGRAVRDSGGVAISNCLLAQTVDHAFTKSACLFQPALQSVAIDDDDGFRIRINESAFRSSLLGRVAQGRDTLRTTADQGRLLVTENQRIWSDWFVWHRKDGQLTNAKQPISDDYELVMTCQKSKSRIGAPGGEFRNFFGCERDFVAKGLFISYSFESENRVPSFDDVKKLDASIMDTVSQMECN